jgi:hypothetical protein
MILDTIIYDRAREALVNEILRAVFHSDSQS